jgi:hypothetical protein
MAKLILSTHNLFPETYKYTVYLSDRLPQQTTWWKHFDRCFEHCFWRETQTGLEFFHESVCVEFTLSDGHNHYFAPDTKVYIIDN